MLDELCSLTDHVVVCRTLSADVVLTCLQIHMRQFHGTRYAAINPAMVSAEELEMSSNQDSEDYQWAGIHSSGLSEQVSQDAGRFSVEFNS